MALSCSCDFEPEPGDKCWWPPEDFIVFSEKRRKRCVSCGKLIELGSSVLKFRRFRIPNAEVECKIYGEDGEIPLAPWYVCEKCGEIYLNLVAIGYECIVPREILAAQKEYWELTGFDPEKYEVAK